jgi:hypothetical protein
MNLWSKLKSSVSKAVNVIRAVTSGAADEVMNCVNVVSEVKNYPLQKSITIGLITIGKHPGGVPSAKSQRSPEVVEQLQTLARNKRERKADRRAVMAYRADLFNDTVPHYGYHSLIGAIS